MKNKLTRLNLFFYAKALSALVVVVSLAATAADVGIRRYSGVMIDALRAGEIPGDIWYLLGGMVILFILLKFAAPYIKTQLNAKLTEKLYLALERQALYAEQSALDGIDPGQASTCFTSDIAGIMQYASRIIGGGIPDLFTFVFSVATVCSMNLWLGVAAVLASVVPVAAMFIMSRKLVGSSAKYQGVVQEINQKIAGYLYNLEFIKANSMESALEKENADLMDKLLHEKKTLARQEAALSAPAMLSSFVTVLAVSVVGGYLVLQGSLSIGELFTAITLTDFVVSPVMRFENTIGQIRRAKTYFARINQYLTLPREKAEAANVSVCREVSSVSLALQDLHFRYPDGKTVFEGLNLRWEAGRLNVIIGENGAGKSTLLKLIGGVYEPQEGAVCLGGAELPDELTKDNVRSAVTIHTQQSVLFADRVTDNLTMGREIAQERVSAVCRAVGIEAEICALPDGYETMLGADGDPLSGGQKRRLCLARTLLRDAPVYILDEPTTGIDPEHIRPIIKTLQELAKEKLVIVITHDPMLIEAADTVTKLEVRA